MPLSPPVPRSTPARLPTRYIALPCSCCFLCCRSGLDIQLTAEKLKIRGKTGIPPCTDGAAVAQRNVVNSLHPTRARTQYEDALGQRHRFINVVRYQYDGLPGLLNGIDQQPFQEKPGLIIKRREWLIQ